jgi:serine/threonine protein kinase
MQNTMSIVPNEPSKAGSDACLPVGTRLSDFEITGVVGEGGFGIVYLAFDHSLQRTVAIKEYMPSSLARRGEDKSVAVRLQREQETFDAGLKSFINEARLLAQFDHPALIKVYRFWEENKTGYMAMRYYEGQTIKGVVKNSPALVTEAWLKGMLKPVLEALEALYRVQVLHRDISPDNIMIQSNGEAVLLDFGAARQIIGDMNHAVTVILKPGYAPIEQYANDAAMAQGPWTDIYSLSAVVFLAIAKKPPPTSVVRMIKDPIEPLQNGKYEGYSKEFLSAIDKGLSVKPEDRPQSIDEFRRMLQLELSVPVPTPGAAAAAPLPVSSASAKQPDADRTRSTSSRPKISSKVIYALGIAAILCGLGIAGYASFRQKAPPDAVAVARSTNSSNALDRMAPARPAESEQNSALSTATGSAVIKPPKAGATGTVRLNVKPWGTVFVDGVSQGASPPLKKLELSEGKHKIRIENPSFRSHTIEIDVTKKKTGIIEHDFSPIR